MISSILSNTNNFQTDQEGAEKFSVQPRDFLIIKFSLEIMCKMC